ncbi:MAG: phosphatidate cytidylyltransferase [Pseudomonadota bacterium]|nr:phosphatidate cytidylyltransferase [Pseudomonadota bacterium]
MSNKSALQTRIATAALLIAGFLAAIYWAPTSFWTGLTGVVAVLAAREWAGMAGLGKTAGLFYAILIGAISTGLVIAAPALSQPFAEPFYPALAFWLLAPTLLSRGARVRPATLHLMLGAIVLIPTHLGLVALRNLSPDLLLVVVGVVVIADSAAYFSGRAFGKHKLAPSISPGKTWEGAIGAWLAVTLYALLLHFFAPATIKLQCLPQVLAVFWMLFGLSVLGDLFESTLKRQAGIKDSGNLLPGHGGILDRIDSLTAVLPAATLFWILLK